MNEKSLIAALVLSGWDLMPNGLERGPQPDRKPKKRNLRIKNKMAKLSRRKNRK